MSVFSIIELRTEYLKHPLGLDERLPRFSWQLASDAHDIMQKAYRIIVSEEIYETCGKEQKAQGSGHAEGCKVRDSGQAEQECVCVRDSGQAEQKYVCVWDSGLVESSETLNLVYAGEDLKPCTRYFWTVTSVLTDGSEAKASDWFETGLLSGSPDAWEGADFIGGSGEDLPFSAHDLMTYHISVPLKIYPGSVRAGIVFGANDRRLMNRNQNILGRENGRNEGYYIVELDLSGLCFSTNDAYRENSASNFEDNADRETSAAGPEDNADRETSAAGPVDDEMPFFKSKAAVRIYRAGHLAEDNPKKPMVSLPVPESLISQNNLHETHVLGLSVVNGVIEPYIDGTVLVDLTGRFSRPGINPMGYGGDYICFPALCDVGIYADRDQEILYGPLTVRNYRKPGNILYEGWPELSDTEGNSIQKEASRYAPRGHFTVPWPHSPILETGTLPVTGMPVLRKKFPVAQEVRRARLYVTARGIYDLYLNGQQVNENEWFSPGLTQYNRRQGYRTYDATAYIQKENVIVAALGEGWWSGAMSFSGENWNFFGDRTSLLLKLVLEMADGSREVVVSDPSWKFTKEGPVRYSGFFQGERVDFRRQSFFETLLRPDFDDSMLKNAEIVPVDSKTVFTDNTVQSDIEYSWMTKNNTDAEVPVQKTDESISTLPPSDNDYDFTWNPMFFGEPEAQVRAVAMLQAQEILNPRPGVYIYDLGQNISGIPKIHFPEGQTGEALLRFAEVLYPALPEYGENQGMIMMENIRAALAQDIIVLDGVERVWSPRFTFHGYRYIEITGLSEPLPKTAVESIALSSVTALAASFETDSPELNRLFQNITWSFRDNFLSIPTDCPQRNERMGWSGDISVFSRTAAYLGMVPDFLRRHAAALRDTQGRNGRFADIAPVGGGFGGVLWGSAGCTVPYESYLQYGDERVLLEQADAMFRYLRFLRAGKDPETGIVNDGPLGDWLGPQVYMTETPFLWQAYYVYDLRIAVACAKLLGRTSEEAEFSTEYEAAFELFNRIYIDPDTHQTVFSCEKEARGLGAHFGPPDEKKSAEKILKTTPSGRFLMDTQTSYAVALALDVVREDLREDLGRHLAACVARENADESGVLRPAFSLMTGFIGTAWILKALSDTGHNDAAWKLLQNDSYPSWLYSVKNGATTIWERLDSYTSERGFGGNNSMNSFNHYSFGAAGDWMLEYAAGIRRSDKPGTFRLAPVPDPTGGIRKLKASVQTVQGIYESAWEVQDDRIIYDITVPAGVATSLTLNGEEKTVGSGSYHYEVSGVPE